MANDQYPSLPNCPMCKNKMIPVSERRGGFSGGKALVGALLVGPVGLAAGALGRKRTLFQCVKCGYQKEI